MEPINWKSTIDLLTSLGFVINSEDLEHPVYDLNAVIKQEYIPPVLVYVEKEFSRNRFAVVLGYDDWEIYVQIDAGCGWVEIPVRWCDIEIEWLTHLKKAFDSEGFRI
jgi:hypothetical protein